MAQFSGIAGGGYGKLRPAIYAWGSGMPGRIIADVLGWVEVGLVVVASVIAKYAYIGVILGQTTQTEPYLLAGFACAVLFRHFQRDRGLNDPLVPRRGTQWRSMLGSLLLAFLALIATAYAFKLSTIFSRGWVTIWFLLACAMLVVGRAVVRHI